MRLAHAYARMPSGAFVPASFLLLVVSFTSLSLSLSLFLAFSFASSVRHSPSSLRVLSCILHHHSISVLHLGVHHHLLLVSFLVVSAFVFPSPSFSRAMHTRVVRLARRLGSPVQNPLRAAAPTTPPARGGGGGPPCARGTRDSFTGTSLFFFWFGVEGSRMTSTLAV